MVITVEANGCGTENETSHENLPKNPWWPGPRSGGNHLRVSIKFAELDLQLAKEKRETTAT